MGDRVKSEGVDAKRGPKHKLASRVLRVNFFEKSIFTKNIKCFMFFCFKHLAPKN